MRCPHSTSRISKQIINSLLILSDTYRTFAQEHSPVQIVKRNTSNFAIDTIVAQ